MISRYKVTKLLPHLEGYGFLIGSSYKAVEVDSEGAHLSLTDGGEYVGYFTNDMIDECNEHSLCTNEGRKSFTKFRGFAAYRGNV